MLPGEVPAADKFYTDMLALSAAALRAARQAWQKVNPNSIVDSWDSALTGLLETVALLQIQAASTAAAMVPNALAEQRLTARPEAAFRPESMAGWASDGRPLESLLATPAETALDALRAGRTPVAALAAGRASVERIVRTQITDAGRVSAGVAVAVRPRTGWVRMLTPPSCDRCLILAGRFYRWSSGFDRHPNDDCVSVPSNEDRGDDLRTDPDAYLKSLSAAEQDRLLGKANAQAWRDGADLNQLVNALRGMRNASVFGQDIQITTEGTTTRGLAGQRLIEQGARVVEEQAEFVRRLSRSGEVTRRVRRQRVQVPRLTPESIYGLAKDRADALRLLRRFGYIL